MIEKKSNKDPEYFEEIMKKKLRNYSFSVDKDSWEEIEIRLKKKRDKTINLYRWIGALSIAALLTFIWLIFPFTKQLSPYYNQTAQSLFYEKDVTKDFTFQHGATSDFSPKAASTPSILTQKKEIFLIKEYTHNYPSDIIDSIPTISDKSKSACQSSKHFDHEITSNENINKSQIDLTKNRKEPVVLSVKNKSDRKSVGLYTGSSSNSLLANNNNTNPLQNNTNSLRGNHVSSNSEEVLEKDQAKEFTDISHYVPLSFGINIRKEINNFLSIETGLTYTYLYSKFKNKVPNEELKQELHYLGIPLNLVGHLYSNKITGFNVYVSVGGLLEKGISANYTHTLYHDDKLSSTSFHENIRGLQCSLNAAIGLDYGITKHYSVFVEPKINYYIHNNQPQSSRTENSFTLGINAGVRYTW